LEGGGVSSKKVKPEKTLAQALGLSLAEFELAAAFNCLIDSRLLNDHEGIKHFSVKIGALVSAQLAKGNDRFLAFAAEGFQRVKDRESIKPGKPASKRHIQILWAAQAFMNERRCRPTAAELVKFLNEKLSAEGEPANITTSDISEAIERMPELRELIRAAKRGRPAAKREGPAKF
jgi:hypothetical protein